MSRLILEVTEFQQTRRWFRHLSGVPRTVMEIGRRLLHDERLEVECVVYVPHAGGFYPADRGLFDEAPPADPAGIARLGGSGGRIAGAARSLVSAAQRTRPTRAAYRVARRTLSRVRGARPFEFRPDDTVLALGAMWGSRDLPDRLAAAQHDVGFRVASLVYDLIPITHPQLYDATFPEQYRHYLDRVLEMSDHLFVISEATGRELRGYCEEQRIIQPTTEVVYLGDGAVVADRAARPAGFPAEDFVLAVSTFEPRKNHEVLYRAVKHAQLTGRVLPRVVVVGSPGWQTRELQFTVRNDPGTRDAFLWLSRTTDAELAWLYANALFTVYPSIVEGWGLPIAESMHFGKFCITSGVSSMPEVAGDLVDYLSPYDPAGWAEAIGRYAGDRTALSEREARIATDYVPHTWDAAAAVVRSAVSGSPDPSA